MRKAYLLMTLNNNDSNSLTKKELCYFVVKKYFIVSLLTLKNDDDLWNMVDTAEGEIIDDVMTPTSNLFDHYIINISIAYIHHLMSSCLTITSSTYP